MLNFFFRPALLMLLLAAVLAGCKKEAEQKIVFHAQATDAISKMNNVGQNHAVQRAHYIDSVYSLLPEIGAGDLWKKYNFLAVCSKHDTKYFQAITYADSALWAIKSYPKAHDYSLLYAQANITKGTILLLIGKFNEASRVFYTAKAIIAANTNTCDHHFVLAEIDGYLAAVSYRQQRYAEAVKLYKITVAGLVDCGKSSEYFAWMQGNLDNVALSFMGTNQPDSALKYYNKALQFIKDNEALHPDKDRYIAGAKGVIYGNRAKAFELKGLYNLAEIDYKKSIEINSRPGFENADANYAKLGLAGLYLKMHRFDSTKMILDTIKPAIKTDTVALLRYFRLTADYLKARNSFQLANEGLEKYLEIKKENEINTSNLNKVDISKDFELLDQRYKLEALKKDNRLKSNYLLNAIAFCIMSMVIIVFFIKSRNRSWERADSLDQYKLQLKLAVNAIEQKNKDLGQLLSVLEHDLKSPMTAIGNMAEILLLEYGRPEDESELIDLIRVTSADMIGSVNNLLEMANKPDINAAEREIIDAHELVFSSVALMKYRAAEKNQTIYLSIGTPGEIFVKINREKLWRVINNLLLNAIKFSSSHTTIYVNMQLMADMVEISVQDSGIGIPEKYRDSLFNMFTDARRKGTAGEQSFGLGLYTTKQIVEAYEGKIWFESAENVGSTFYVSFPVQKMF